MTEIKLTQSKHNKIILFLMALIFAIFFVYTVPLNLLVTAESNRVTSVIEDLQTDPNFSVEAYPSNSGDYSLQIIQIAESTAKELFVYVYQPSAVTTELKAISINISTSIGDNFAPKNYDLTFLNSRGVFQKYVVEDFYVKNDALRYYDIISIFRAWNEDLDDKPGADQTISERSYAVGQLWTACTVNGEVSYSYETEETITITDKFVGFVRYLTHDGGIWQDWISGGNSSCDRHFVAFSTDKQIDELIEAEVEFETQSVRVYTYSDLGSFGGPKKQVTYGDIKKAKSTLKITDEKTVNATVVSGFTTNSFSYSWKSIQTVEEFKNSVDTSNMFTGAIFNTTVTTKVNEENIKDLDNKQWVLTFDNTNYSLYDSSMSTTSIDERYSTNSNITILRLKFLTGGVPYNLGVVDNKQTGSGKPINTTTVTNDWGWLMKIIVQVLKIIFYVILAIVGLLVLKLVIDVIKAIFNKRR